MPLPGGPSDKYGNRYELRWLVRLLVDMIVGRIDWLRIEVPGDDSIECRFGCGQSTTGLQVKRGISGGGHWSIGALKDVIAGAATLLSAETETEFVFASQHAASELQELSERARSALTASEFLEKFLAADWLARSWLQLLELCGTSPEQTWALLRRLTVKTISEDVLCDDADSILALLFEGNPGNIRSLLTQLALDSIHKRLEGSDVLAHLDQHGVIRRGSSGPAAIAPPLTPPPAVGVRRDVELAYLDELLLAGCTSVALCGISGIGKSTLAAQFAANWKGPVCWLDMGLFRSGSEAIAALGEFLKQSLGEDWLNRAKVTAPVASLARLAGALLGAGKVLVVWDGIAILRSSRIYIK